jgi:heat shock protein HspQ
MQNLLWISPKIDLQVEGIGRLLEHGRYNASGFLINVDPEFAIMRGMHI